MNADAIVVRGLHKRFADRAALTGVELVVPEGQLLGLVGPNGAGKSTLLRILCGLVHRTAGDVQVLGIDPRDRDLALRHQLSYLPGETGVYSQMTGGQFLDFALSFHRGRQTGLERRLLDAFELPLSKLVRSYSAGMKQKLALIAALVPDVPLYLLDEPDRALDASVRFFLREVLLDLRADGRTVLLSSHHLSEVETLADRLQFLLDGALVADERVADAQQQLRRRPRVRLADGATLPAGAEVVRAEPDGMLVIETAGDPLAWLRGVPDGRIAAVEIGTTRLEDLYQVLLQGRGGAP